MIDLVRIAEQLPLSRSEKKEIRSLVRRGGDQRFLVLHRIFKNHNLANEATELLTWAVSKFPSHKTARVILAEDYFHRGLIRQAWDLLKTERSSLSQNNLAQRLMFQLCVLLELDQTAHSVLTHLKAMRMTDELIDRVGFQLTAVGISQAREQLLESLVERKIPVAEIRPPEQAASVQAVDGLREKAVDFFSQVDLSGFDVMALDEIVQPSSAVESCELTSQDERIRADLLERGGQYFEALRLYRGMLAESPQNSELVRKVKELARKAREQKLDDIMIDPLEVLRTENLEKQRSRVYICHRLLKAIEHVPSNRPPASIYA